METKQRVLTGIKPTGDLHVGNYFGAIQPCVEYSNNPDFEVILMCADWHGLTDRAKIFEPRENTVSTVATFLALGFNLSGNIMILQSDFPQIQENAWYLSCVTAVGMLERSHAYKDALQNGKKPTGGLFYYPVLMASDILSFDSDIVPVGKDQTQHLEYTVDMAQLFNNAVGKPVYKEVKSLKQERPLLVGVDGERKMSKSYNNQIPLFGAKKDIEKRIKEIKTDSKGLDDPKDPDTCAVFQILSSFGSAEAIEYMRGRLTQGKGYGYGHAKMDLISEHERVFGSRREIFEDFRKQLMSPTVPFLREGYERARTYADEVRERARSALGLSKFRPW